MPDATGLELLAQRIRGAVADDAVVGTAYQHEQAMLEVAPARVREVLTYLRDKDEEPYEQLLSLHGVDYLPEEPRLGVHYQLLARARRERLGVKTRVTVEDPVVPSVVDIFPTANFHEREAFDMFGLLFDGHPDPRRILLPEDYEGFPQRRDFPVGGEPVLFTHNEHKYPRWYE
ncbi:MAG TPA: NADH-quinone oxidoreductase subunit C [Thermoleophilaceae bacterium]|nr:NADH-quinone oxidoreductase subunit C [Thermoleophilaceae bacterium]